MSAPISGTKQLDYHCEWERYRQRRNRIALYLVVEFLGYLPFVALVVSAERRLFGTTNLGLPAALAWGALYLYTGSRLRSFPCPRCGKNFFAGLFATPWKILARKCAHCRLPMYAGA
jgi:hypothetical protein